MTWTPPTDPIPPPLNSVVPDRVFYEWDCTPLSFTTTGECGQIWFVHWMSSVDTVDRHLEQYLAVLITPERAELLAANRLPVLDALESFAALVLIVDMADWRVVQAWRTRTVDVPADYLPVPGVMMSLERVRDEVPTPQDRLLPVACRDIEITEDEFDALCRIASDPNATKGRLTRIPRRVPLREED